MNIKKQDLPNQMEKELTKIVTDPPEQHHISSEMIEAIKAQVVAEMQNDATRIATENKIRHEQERKEHDEYVVKMKSSPNPWVEIEGWAENTNGVKVELEWNEAFVVFLRSQGISGSDDDQVVQKWITLLMQDMTTKMSEETKTDFE